MYITKEYSVYYICLSYVSAVLGSYVSITLVDEVRLAEKARQFYFWVTCAAFAIGGAGIWTMHFIGMQSLSLGAGRLVVYDIGLTILSIFVSVPVPWLALYFVAISLNPTAVGRTKAKLTRKALSLRIAFSGICCGIGIGGMHYTGMGAMMVDKAHPEYNAGILIASVIIAMAASTVALWIMFFLRGIPQRIIVSFVMGIAVTGMHYTGMAAVNYVDDPSKPLPDPLPIRFVYGESLGLYADVVASIVRFLLLGLVYASEFLRGRQMESYYLKARGKLVKFDPISADELPLPKSSFSRRAEKDTTFSKIRFIFMEVFGFADTVDYDFGANSEQVSPEFGRHIESIENIEKFEKFDKFEKFEKSDSSVTTAISTPAETPKNLSRMTSNSTSLYNNLNKSLRNPLRDATSLMIPPNYNTDVENNSNTIIVSDPDLPIDPPISFDPPPFTRRNSITTSTGEVVPTPIFRSSTGSFRKDSQNSSPCSTPTSNSLRTSTGSMPPNFDTPPNFNSKNRRHSNAEPPNFGVSATTSNFRTSGSFKNSSSTPSFRTSTGSFSRPVGSTGSLPVFDAPPGFSPAKRRHSNGNILYVSNLSVEIVIEEKPEDFLDENLGRLDEEENENLTLNTCPSLKSMENL